MQLWTTLFRRQVVEIPIGNYNVSDSGWNRYDTDNEHVVHLWADGKSFDIRIPRADVQQTA